jgi:DNA-binding NarL/FixJ family response regulator
MTNPPTIDIVRDDRRLREALSSLLARQPLVSVEELMQVLREISRDQRNDANGTNGTNGTEMERARCLEVRDVRVTQREREVIALIGDGLSNNEIAREMNVATHTVKTHVRNIMVKLGVRSRLQIAARIYREHWTPAMSA